jgi:hypothetical protein
VPAWQRSSDASLLHRLEAATQRNRQLAEENRKLSVTSTALRHPHPPRGAAAEGAGHRERGDRQRILRETAAAGGDLSAAECAYASGVSRVSARKYLEHFVTTGRAEVRLWYGGTGHPERSYRWARWPAKACTVLGALADFRLGIADESCSFSRISICGDRP